ncbi:hypothetical protein FNYG_02923 [Fusarium nygamai]|uniref:Uncharacterized protein n=1 Tax=Gibberella nygamai TaxID=42673 RepID=A0A2K0WN43_GIBNY|nr:hypothetical protein FNYG_02923 [Fusarium nygamai]
MSKHTWVALVSFVPVLFFLFSLIYPPSLPVSKRYPVYHSSVPQKNDQPPRPITIVLSIDGFAAGFLQRNITPNLSSFASGSFSPEYLKPSFPSATFPNHVTLVTGLYPESHGIVGNKFWDPSLQQDFVHREPSISNLEKWWDVEPIWARAEMQGIPSAVLMWPGAEVRIKGMLPTFLQRFKEETISSKKYDILELLDLPISQRPRLIMSYIHHLDAMGHMYGPNSNQVNDTLREIDAMFGEFLAALDRRGLKETVNLIVLSDHGMTERKGLIQLEDLVARERLRSVDGSSVLAGLWPVQGENSTRIYHDILSLVQRDYADKVAVYLKHETMPPRFRFTRSHRIAPIWIVPKPGWAVLTKEEFDIQQASLTGKEYHTRGFHGYDNEEVSMRTIFMARGPAFARASRVKVAPFRELSSIEMVNLRENVSDWC